MEGQKRKFDSDMKHNEKRTSPRQNAGGSTGKHRDETDDEDKAGYELME